jgi:hypothetical protein
VRGAAEEPDATIVTDPATLSMVLWHERPLAEALSGRDMRIAGSNAAVTRFVGLFPLPAGPPG